MSGSGALTTDLIRTEGMAVIRCMGELDISTEDAIFGAITDALARPVFYLCLDFRDLRFCDSTLLRVLDVARAEGRNRDIEVRVLEGPATQRLQSF